MIQHPPASERSALARYGVSLLAVALAVLLRWPLQPFLGGSVPYLFFFPAIMLAAWYGRLGPGLLATALSAVIANLFFLPPYRHLGVQDFGGGLSLAIFVAIGVLISILNERLHQERAGAEERERELRRAQGAAQASEERFRLTANVAPVMIWMAGPDRARDWFNQPWLDFRGRTLDQELGDGWIEGIHPDDRALYLAEYNAAFEERRPFATEYRLRRGDGEYRWILAKGTPRLGPGGGLEGFIGVCLDIHDRRLAQEELEVMNRMGRILLAERDRDHLVQAITEEATAITRAGFGAFFYNVVREGEESYTLYTLSGVPREAFADFPMPRNTHVFAPTFNGEGVVRSDDITQDPRYGRNPPYHGMPEGHLPVRSYLAVPVISGTGAVLGGLFFGHDRTGVFTEREERIVAGIATQAAVALDNVDLYHRMNVEREKAEEASRSKDQFLATISHELRTPLNAILGWTQLLQADGNDPGRVEKGLETIVRNARLQAQLVDDLLDVSRIVTGKMRLDVRPTDVAGVITAAVEAVRPAAEAKKISLLRVLDPLAGPVSGDPARLQQIVWNLLSNAIKFTPKGGKVEIRLERVNSHLEIIVADNGPGIAADFLPHVFDRFRQLDGSTTRQFGGLGLGLAIVRHLVELHGGTVRVKSPGPGQGSTFIVELPVSVAHLTLDDSRVHPKAGGGADEGEPADLTGVRVLVVDDEPDARDTLRQILELCHAEVRTAESARDALLELATWRPHVLLSDIGMPVTDGYELIRQVRALPREEGGRTPAAALTAFARSEDRRRALQAGFQLHVAKPVEIRELAAVVASLAGG